MRGGAVSLTSRKSPKTSIGFLLKISVHNKIIIHALLYGGAIRLEEKEDG